MTPRLTKYERMALAKTAKESRKYGIAPGASHPSPAERLRQRRKSRAAVMRSLKNRDEVDLHIAYLMGKCDHQWSQSRGAATEQSVTETQ